MNLLLIRKTKYGYVQIKFKKVISFLQTSFDKELEIHYVHKETGEIKFAVITGVVQMFIDFDKE